MPATAPGVVAAVAGPPQPVMIVNPAAAATIGAQAQTLVLLMNPSMILNLSAGPTGAGPLPGPPTAGLTNR